jgi:hypothetical protein
MAGFTALAEGAACRGIIDSRISHPKTLLISGTGLFHQKR